MIEVSKEVSTRPNPSIDNNPENILFREWKEASPNERPAIERRLHPLLKNHASRMAWLIIHRCPDHLTEEIAQDAIMELDRFEGRSAFSTWFHSRARNACKNVRRVDISRREVSLEDVKETSQSLYDEPTYVYTMPLENKILVRELYGQLSPESKELVDLKVFQGLSDVEIAAKLGVSHTTVYRMWLELKTNLRNAYNGAEVR